MNATPEPASPERARLREIHGRMQSAAAQIRLPFRLQAWSGQTGNWMGSGIGSSIDFQDHRPYMPGDDPRYIDWQAYARSGHYTMKLYREEVTPRVDLVLDVSRSMALTPAKETRFLELAYFAAESAWQGGASLRSFLVQGSQARVLDAGELQRGSWWPLAPAKPVEAKTGDVAKETKASSEVAELPAWEKIPWRSGSLRVIVSDLLFACEPGKAWTTWTHGKGRALVLAPFVQEEAEPAWDGNIRFVDCETEFSTRQRVESDLLARYREAYRRHFSLWREQAQRHQGFLARVSSEVDFLTALRAEALPQGAVELWT